MRHPSKISAYALAAGHYSDTKAEVPGCGWQISRPEGYASFWSRVSLAWRVFIGQADALVWPGQGN